MARGRLYSSRLGADLPIYCNGNFSGFDRYKSRTLAAYSVGPAPWVMYTVVSARTFPHPHRR